jgi:hypothetical protein
MSQASSASASANDLSGDTTYVVNPIAGAATPGWVLWVVVVVAVAGLAWFLYKRKH